MQSSRRGRVATVYVALLAGVAGSCLIWVAFSRPATPPRGPGIDSSSQSAVVEQARRPRRQVMHSPSRVDRRGVDDLTRGLVLPEAKPLELSIPRLNVRSALVTLGVDSTGAMEVPPDPAVAGWYDLGPTPGALGPAVISGHVTWNRAPAVFFELERLRRGDLVRVGREDGREAVFAVRRVARYDKARFPTEAVFDAIDHAGLRLITCGGAYDGSAHRYLDNVVVFASLVAERPTRP